MAEELELGSGYVQLLPSGRGFQKKAQAEVNKAKVDKTVKLDADITRLQAKVEQAKAKVEQIRSAGADPQIGLDIAELQAKAQLVEQRLARLRTEQTTAKVTADTAAGEAQLGRFERRIGALETRRSTATVDADVAAAEAGVSRFEGQLSRLRAQRAQVTVDADTAGANAALGTTGRLVSSLDGRSAQVSVAAGGAAQTSAMLGMVVGGFAAVASIAPVAGAAAATALASMSGAGQGAAAVVAGFSGIGDAVKASAAAEESAASSSASAGASRQAAMRGVASAARGLETAQIQAARTAVQGDLQVADSARAVGRARQQADRAAITGAQQVASARRSLADSIVQSGRRIADGERSVGRAQESARWAQEGLTRARRDAVEANEDLQLSLGGVALSERRAMIAQRKAQQALNEGRAAGATGLELEELQLDVDEATHNIAEVRERFGDLRTEQAEWARTGVAGSEQVRSAQRGVEAANLSVQDSVRQLSYAQVDGSRQVSEAALAVGLAQQQASWATQDALAGVEDAQRQATMTALQAGWANQDAARGVVDAQRAMRDAMIDAAAGGGAASDSLRAKLDKLSPAGRNFVRFLTDEWQPAWQRTSHAVAEELLPRVQQAMRTTIGLEPLFRSGLAESGRVIGDLAVQGANMATSGPWRADFATIMDSNNRSLRLWGEAGLFGADAARHLVVAGLPLQERLAGWARESLQGAAAFLEQKRATGELTEFMNMAAAKGVELWDAFTALVGAGYQLGVALAPVGSVLLDIVSGTAQVVGWVAQANPALVQWGATALIATTAFASLGNRLLSVGAGVASAAGGYGRASSALTTLLVPTRLYAATQERVSGAVSRAGASAGAAVGGFDRNSAAAERGAAAGSRFGNSLARIGSTIPLIGAVLVGAGLAYDAFVVSTDEATSALLEGGLAADKMNQELAKQGVAGQQTLASLSPLVGVGRLFGDTQQEAAAKTALLRAQMTPLQRAQTDVTYWTNEHALALNRFGQGSPQAMLATQNLALANDRLELEQIAAANATDLHTAAMLRNQNQALTAVNADLAMQGARLQIQESQAALNRTVDQYGIESLEAQRAQLSFQQSIPQFIGAVQAAAQAEAERNNVTDKGKFVTDAVNRAIFELAATMQGPLPPALATMIGGMDHAALTALGARIKTDEFGHSIAVLPDGREVPISAPGAVQAAGEINAVAGALERVNAANQYGVASLEMSAGMGPRGQLSRNRGRARGGVDIPRGMATGGTLRRDVAQRVPPRQPVMMGDRMQGTEYFLPDDATSRSMAIGAEWARARGLALVPRAAVLGMAGGGILAMATGGALAPTGAAPAAGSGAGAPQSAAAAPPELMTLTATEATATAAAVQGLTVAVQALQTTGLVPLAAELTAVTLPTLALVQQQAGIHTTLAVNTLAASLPPLTLATQLSGLAMRTDWAATTLAVQTSQLIQSQNFALLAFNHQLATQQMTLSQLNWQNFSNASWANIAATTGFHVGQITGPIFGGLYAGLAAVQQAVAFTVQWWAGQMATIQEAAAVPVRWTIANPFNRGILAAWRSLDGQFSMGKPVNDVPITFAEGGIHEDHRAQIAPAGAWRMWAEPETGGEAYIPLASSKRSRSTGVLSTVADRFGYDLAPRDTREGATHGPIRLADGGILVAPSSVDFFADSGLWRRMTGVVQQGVPGTRLTSAYRAGDSGYHGSGRAGDFAGPRSMDTAFMARINQWIASRFGAGTAELIHTPGINLLNGRPHSYNAGTQAQHRDHVHWAIENEGVLAGAPGNFAGNPGGGAAFDPTPIVEAEFKKAYDLIAEGRRRFPSPHGARTLDVAQQGADQVKAKALAQLATMFASSMMGPVGAGAPFIVGQISDSARARGYGHLGASIGVATGLVESNLQNLNYGDRDSLGVFQQRPSQGWGSPAQIMNVRYAADQFFNRFPRDWRARAATDAGAGAVAQSVQRSAFPGKYAQRMPQARGLVTAHGGVFDLGGILRPGQFGINHSGRPERVLDPRQTAAFEQLVPVLSDVARGTASWLRVQSGTEIDRLIGRHGGEAAVEAQLRAGFARLPGQWQDAARQWLPGLTGAIASPELDLVSTAKTAALHLAEIVETRSYDTARGAVRVDMGALASGGATTTKQYVTNVYPRANHSEAAVAEMVNRRQAFEMRLG